MDCLEGMKYIEDNSVSLVLCDLPYGTTACSWDSVIPLELLWEEYNRIITDNGTLVFTGSQPFTTELINSQRDLFKYSLVWFKNRPTGFPHAKNKPLKAHEDILIFSKGNTNHESLSTNRMCYNPQDLIKQSVTRKQSVETRNSNTFFRSRKSHKDITHSTHKNYPVSVLFFKKSEDMLHPTQKPVELFEYLVRTYSNENELVLDNCMGSGTTAIACINADRNFIGFENNEEYFKIAEERIKNHQRTTKTKATLGKFVKKVGK